jgi:RNA polymerase sigma-B factor
MSENPLTISPSVSGGSAVSLPNTAVPVSSVGVAGNAGNDRAARPFPKRVDEEQAMRWLLEYVRRRESETGEGRRTDTLTLGELKSRLAFYFTPLVESIARRFVSSGEPFEDLVQEGFLGLLSALEHYDTTKGVKFSTYATHFVAGAIRHCLRDRGKIIKEPAWLHETYSKITRTQDTLTQQLGRPPHAAEIARVLNLTEESVEEILATRQVFQVVAFDTGSSDGDDSMVGLVDPEKIRSDKYVSLQLPIEDRIVLEESALKLKALEQRVLHEFFYKDHNQTEIAKKMGISCNYVSHILKNSTQKLRKILGEAEVRDRTRAREASIVDSTSGLYTEDHILARLDEEISRTARASQSLAFVMIVLDGVPASGLRREEFWTICGEVVRKGIRRMDIAGRYEKDCIAVILPGTGAQVSIVADRLSDRLLAVAATHHVPLSVTVGMSYFPDHGRTMRELLAMAREGALTAQDDELFENLLKAA